MTDAEIFELKVRSAIDESFPASTLSSVCLFQADQFATNRRHGSEIDHLVHVAGESLDHLLIVECKNQPIQFKGQGSVARQEWTVSYRDREGRLVDKFIKSQMFAQAQALLQNLYPRHRRASVVVHAVTVSSADATPMVGHEDAADPKLHYHLLSFVEFTKLCRQPEALSGFLRTTERLRVVRVNESDILRMVRHGLPVSHLGHPEVPNALRYVARCREILDCELIKLFKPTKDSRWAINGAAGMGKTVLLAYTAVVFSSDRIIVEERADRQFPKRTLQAWSGEEFGVSPLHARKVSVYGLKEKQREILMAEVTRMTREFEALADHATVVQRLPAIGVWRDNDPLNCDVLLIDEAHDLTPRAQQKIAEWWHAGKGRRYLVVACDRHQKLRLVGEDATILEGVDFRGCSMRLSRNYRSPTPVYVAALGLMFRWFGAGGAKVVPSRGDLVNGFGFTLEDHHMIPERPGARVELSLTNDCHPANFWSYSVSRFASWEVAADWLKEWGLRRDQVLWVRFERTDPHMDDDRLEPYRVQSLLVQDPDYEIDTHIKGREFAVVMIEGLPAAACDQSSEVEMLRWRRRLYLCASRATCFLFFIMPPALSAEWEGEMNALLRCCSVPPNPTSASSKFWKFTFDYPEKRLRGDLFKEIDAEPTSRAAMAVAENNDAPVVAAMHEVPATVATQSPPAAATAQNGSAAAASTSGPVVAIQIPAEAKNAPAVAPRDTPHIEAVPLTEARTNDHLAEERVLTGSAPEKSVVVTPPRPVQTPQDIAAVAKLKPEAPPLLTEKEFQRAYGNERGWKEQYQRYRATGVLPTYRPRGTTHPVPIAKPIDSRPRVSIPQAKPSSAFKELRLTPKLIAAHLGKRPFEITRTAIEVGHVPAGLDIPLPDAITLTIYRRFNAEIPSEEIRQRLGR